jgi:hypothetical protein
MRMEATDPLGQNEATALKQGLRELGWIEGRNLLPVEQPSKFEFIVNMKTAQTLGLTAAPSMQLLADELIE